MEDAVTPSWQRLIVCFCFGLTEAAGAVEQWASEQEALPGGTQDDQLRV